MAGKLPVASDDGLRCPHCNELLDDDVGRCCEECGGDIESAEAPEAPPAAQPEAERSTTESAPAEEGQPRGDTAAEALLAARLAAKMRADKEGPAGAGDTRQRGRDKQVVDVDALVSDAASTEVTPTESRASDGPMPRKKQGKVKKSACNDLEVVYNISRIFVEKTTFSFDFRLRALTEDVENIVVAVKSKSRGWLGMDQIEEDPYEDFDNEVESYIEYEPPTGYCGEIPVKIYVGYTKDEQQYWFLARKKHMIYRATAKAQQVVNDLTVKLVASQEQGEGNATDNSITQCLDGLEQIRPKEDDPVTELNKFNVLPAWEVLPMRTCGKPPGLGQPIPPSLGLPPDKARLEKLTLRTADGSLVHLLSADTVTLGKNREWSDVVTRNMDRQGIATRDTNSAISKRHCRIRAEGDECEVLDGDGHKPSMFGTFVDGRRVPKGESALLPEGVSFRLTLAGAQQSGPSVFTFDGRLYSCNGLGKCGADIHSPCNATEPSCLVLQRGDGIREIFVLVWRFMGPEALPKEAARSIGHIGVIRYKDAFAAVTGSGSSRQITWLVPGENMGGVKVSKYKQFGQWANK